MEKSVSDKLAGELTCECGGNLVAHIGSRRQEERRTYFLQCFYCKRRFWEETDRGMKKRPLSSQEQVFAEDAAATKIKQNLRGENFIMAETSVTKVQQRESEQFATEIIAQMKKTGTHIKLTEHQQRLAQRLWIACDLALRDLEQKRLENPNKKNMAPITWANIDRDALALQAWERVDLGLDALIPDHIWPIPYWDSHKKKYNLNLQIGYAGKHYYKCEAALDKPLNIRYELVHKNDTFIPIMSSGGEGYEFKINSAFNRGDIVGGFGYIQYDDERKNKLVLVSADDIEDAHKASKSKGDNDFYKKYPVQMALVVVVRKTTRELAVDPKKISVAYRKAEAADDIIEGKGTIIESSQPVRAVEPRPALEAPKVEDKPAASEPAKVAASAAESCSAAPGVTDPPPTAAETGEGQNSGKSEVSLKDQFIAAAKEKGYRFDTEVGIKVVRTWLADHRCPMEFQEATEEKQKSLIAEMQEQALPF